MSYPGIEKLIRELREKPILPAALLACITLLLYSPVRNFQFLTYDDPQYVTLNAHVNTGLTPQNIVWAFTSLYEGNWDPVSWLSHMLDCQLFGLNAGPHHLVNVVFHAANVFLLFLLLIKATGAFGRSFLVAALLAVHPLNVENVAWIAERKSLLSAFFSLLAIAAYGWYVKQPGWKRYSPVVAAFALALMSKPMAVSLPLVLLLLDYWPLDRYAGTPFSRRWKRLVVEKLPLLAMAAASSAVTILAQRSAGALRTITDVPAAYRAGNAAVSCVRYVGKFFWPEPLSVFYPLRPIASYQVLAAVLLLGAISVAVFYLRRRRFVVVGWLLFLVMLFPVIGVVQIASFSMADRFAYLPNIGLSLMLVWGLYDIAKLRKATSVAAPLMAVCLVIVLAAATARYLQSWQDGIKLFSHARAVTSEPSAIIEQKLGDAALMSGQSEEAFGYYRSACELQPEMEYCHYQMAQILYQRRQFRPALAEFRLAAKLSRNLQIALISLNHSAEISLMLGDAPSAEGFIERALQIDPQNRQTLALRQWAERERASGGDAAPR